MRENAKKCVDAQKRLFYRSGIIKDSPVKTLTITQLAQYTNIPKRTLYDMIKDGRFPVEPIKGLQPRRWNVEDVDQWRGVQK